MPYLEHVYFFRCESKIPENGLLVLSAEHYWNFYPLCCYCVGGHSGGRDAGGDGGANDAGNAASIGAGASGGAGGAGAAGGNTGDIDGSTVVVLVLGMVLVQCIPLWILEMFSWNKILSGIKCLVRRY